mmetsp:Transcript_24135/g.56193  ORF Transcript_24135/g.56193 Transcript_24135/m.56193 type:complete len:368 (-) Transcript_24135:73-1176(-)
MGDVASSAFASRRAGLAVYGVVYGYNLLGQSSYLLVLGTSLQQVLWPTHLCITVAIALACAAVLVPACAIRRLGDSVWLCLANTVVICVVVAVALADVALQHRQCVVYPVPPGLSTTAFLGQATNVVYAFAGQWMYFELMETMVRPQSFLLAFAISGPFMVLLYLAVALVAYSIGARADDLLAAMDRGAALRAAAALLFVHVVIVYVVKSVVLARFLHGCWSPDGVDAVDAGAWLRHTGLCAALLGFGYVVANAVPFFSQLLGLIGGLLAGPINFLLPMVLYLAARRRHATEVGYGSCVATAGLASAFRGLPVWEILLLGFTLVLTLLTMVVGVADQVRQIMSLEVALGAPFSCHALAATPADRACA